MAINAPQTSVQSSTASVSTPKAKSQAKPSGPIGPSTLLIGPPGTGKTYSLPTLIAADLELFVIITDPGGEESLLDSMRDRKLSIEKLHYHYIAPAAPAWSALLDLAQKVTNTTFESLSKLKTGVSKPEYNQFYELLSCLADFKCDRTGESFGPVDFWDSSRALAIDSMSGINTMAWNMTVGAKPTAHMGEWGVAMNCLERLYDKLTADLHCFFVMTAHVEREVDEIAGGLKLMVSSLGRKLAPKIPRNYSDVILAERQGKGFFWNTIAPGVDLKTRSLPLHDKINPDFGQIVEAWLARQKLAAT